MRAVKYTNGATQANKFQLFALTRVHCHPGMQRESSDPGKLISAIVTLFPEFELFATGRTGVEHFAPRPHEVAWLSGT